jgi:patatin-like phospholipase/acyl hydrolase
MTRMGAKCTSHGSFLSPELTKVKRSFVVTCRANATNDGQQVVLLRSYDTKNDHSQRKIPVEYTLPDIAIWEAARATSAAPAYFQRLTHNGHEFIDGGMVYNNPSILYVAALFV